MLKRIITAAIALVMVVGLLPLTALAASFTPRTTNPGVTGVYYNTGNPFPSKGKNCTWYAYGRAYELLGSKPKLSTGDAKNWYANTNDGYKRGSTPKLGAIACWAAGGNHGSTGHVAVVEKIEGSNVYLSESGSTEAYYPGGFSYGHTVSWHGATFQGYIYILDDSTPAAPAVAEPLPAKSEWSTISDGQYKILSKVSGKYVSAANSKESGKDTYVYEWVDGADQKFNIEKLSDGTYKIASTYGGVVLDVRGASKENGAIIQTYTWNDTDAQHWILVSCGDGWYKIISKVSGKALDVTSAGTANNTKLQQYKDNGTDAQKFKFEPISVSVEKFTVTFKDWNGTVLKSESVEKGKSAVAPANPAREGYSFIGWDNSFNNVTANITVTAQYTKITGSTTDTEITPEPVSPSPTPSKVEIERFDFVSTPSKDRYLVGETLDTTGLIMTAYYSDGSNKTISNGFTCSPTRLTETGTQNINVTYQGIWAGSFSIYVAEETVYNDTPSDEWILKEGHFSVEDNQHRISSYIYGDNRVSTSVAISQKGWKSAQSVILAPGGDNNLVDALAAAPLAGQEDAPILLSVDNTIDPAVIAEIQRLGASKIIAVGALSQTVADQLQTIFPGITIETLRGADRFATAALINAKISNPQGTVVVGYNAIADAVSIASWAAANRYAIHIANPDGSATPPSYGNGTNYILGGPTLVQNIPSYTRIYGVDRYATNLALRQTLSFNNEAIIYTADGNTLVDALTGSVLAAKNRSAIVLTPNNDPTGTDFGNITADTKVYGFGGAK